MVWLDKVLLFYLLFVLVVCLFKFVFFVCLFCCFQENGGFRLQSRLVKGIYQAQENSKQLGASAIVYFNVGCYSGAYTVDSIEVKQT